MIAIRIQIVILMITKTQNAQTMLNQIDREEIEDVLKDIQIGETIVGITGTEEEIDMNRIIEIKDVVDMTEIQKNQVKIQKKTQTKTERETSGIQTEDVIVKSVEIHPEKTDVQTLVVLEIEKKPDLNLQ
jgi:hypothetical protein